MCPVQTSIEIIQNKCSHILCSRDRDREHRETTPMWKSEAISDSSRHPRVGASGNWHQQAEREHTNIQTLLNNPVSWHGICALLQYKKPVSCLCCIITSCHIPVLSLIWIATHTCTCTCTCTYQPVTGGALATLLWFKWGLAWRLTVQGIVD